ncbi:MAG: autotransporter domain-containing protein [Alphaproteobacteria bacterium]
MRHSFLISRFIYRFLTFFSIFCSSCFARNIATLYWNGSTDGSWNTINNWNDYGQGAFNATGVAPDRLYTASASGSGYDCLGFLVYFDDRGAAQTTINLESGSSAGLDPYGNDLDVNTIQLESIEFLTRDGGDPTPSYTLNLSGPRLEVGRISNTSGVTQTFTIPANKTIDINSGDSFGNSQTQGITLNNSGQINFNGSNLTTSGTITNNASTADARGLTIIGGESSVDSWDLINDGGATWAPTAVGFTNTFVRNKVSSTGVPGYMGIASEFNANTGIHLGFDITANKNGFMIIAANSINTSRGNITADNGNISFYLDPTHTYTADTRNIIYRNGDNGGSIDGVFDTINIYDLEGNVLENAAVELNYDEGEAQAAPSGVAIPDGLDLEDLQDLTPILRAIINYIPTSAPTTLSEETRHHVHSTAQSINKSLEKVRTAVHKIFSTVSHGIRQSTWTPSSWGQSNSSGSQNKGLNDNSFKAPSLTQSYLANTEGMMGIMAQETFDRFAPLRTEKTGIWAQPFGQVVEQERTGQESGFDSRTAGILFGMDHKITQKLVVGGGIGSANSTSELKSNGSKAQITDQFATVFASWTDDNWYAETMMTAALNKFKMGRKIDPNTVATNKHDGYQLVPSIGAGYRILLEDKQWLLVPNISTTMIYGHEDGYTEIGAGANNQTIKGRCSSMLRTEAGFNLSTHKIHESVTAIYSIGLKMIVMDPMKKGHINGTVGGNGFGITSNDKTKIYGGLTLSSEFKLNDNWFMNANYAGEFGEHLKAHEIALRLGKRF